MLELPQSGLMAISVAVGENHTFVVARNKQINRLYCWGHVADGRLGSFASSVFVRVRGTLGFILSNL